MDLAFTPEEQQFRAEIRAWVGENLPRDISHKVHNALRMTRDEYARKAERSLPGRSSCCASRKYTSFTSPGASNMVS